MIRRAVVQPLRLQSTRGPSLRPSTCGAFKDNLAELGDIAADVKEVFVTDGDDDEKRLSIPNVLGKQASVKVYAAVAEKFDGALSMPAIEEGLELYAEMVDAAKASPGSHPAIDYLLRARDESQDSGRLQVVKY